MSEEKKDVKPDTKQINLKVTGQDNTVVHFKIKTTTPLKKLMQAYCDRQGLSIHQLRFTFDGERINHDATPESLNMEEDDSIDVFKEMQGGGHCKERPS